MFSMMMMDAKKTDETTLKSKTVVNNSNVNIQIKIAE